MGRTLRRPNSTSADFEAEWSKLMGKALELKKFGRRLTFHDLRAYYVPSIRQNAACCRIFMQIRRRPHDASTTAQRP
ncbi:hypothetical protein B0O95_10555 [Mycetohabitans endofungorum]|uniref:Uncharacterized protein n=1 Tax=Mycetohabitans endofungorum TaxID=417203 RepID=A0A2P5KAZ5_9BURK|nr:hypothetical protein B0O95_10555 [Mycetohabitans endofungorum]